MNSISGKRKKANPKINKTHYLWLIIFIDHIPVPMTRSLCMLMSLLLAPILVYTQSGAPVHPSDRAVVSDTVVTFTWNPIAGGNATYRLQVSQDSLFGTTQTDLQGLTENRQTVTLSMGNQYFWRTGYALSGNPAPWSAPFRLTTFTPSLIPGIVAWFEPDTGITLSGNSVQSWQSRKGSMVMSQSAPTKQPLKTDSLVFRSAGVYFDGVDDFLEGPFLNQQAFTLVALHHPLNKNSSLFSQARFSYTGFNWNINNSQRPSINCLQTPSNAAYIFSGHPYGFTIPTARASIDAITFSNNGITMQTGMADTSTSQTISFLDVPSITYSRMGAMGNNSSWFKGVIYEFLVADSILSYSDRAKLFDYLAWKYQPPVNLGPDIHITYSFCDIELQPTHQYRTYLWSTGDTAAAITTGTPGTYWLLVTDFLGRTSSDTIVVTKQLPVISLTDTTICYNTQALLNPGFTGAYQFTWNNNPLLNQPVLITSVAGTYTLMVTDTFNCSISDTVELLVDTFALHISLGPDRSLCQGEMLTLASGAAQTVGYQWSTSPSDTLPHIYIQNPGSYSVTATNQSGCSGTSQIQLQLKGLAPVVGFQFPTASCLNNPAFFMDQSYSLDPYDAPAIWQWNLGDGSSSSQQVFSHLYPAPGVYPVTLHITTDSGCTGQFTDTIHILPLPGVTISHAASCHQEPVTFQPGTSAIPVQSFFWRFYHGTPTPASSMLQNPSFTWQNPGDYPVTLVVTATNSCAASDSITLTVAQKPHAILNVFPDPGCRSFPVTFTDLSNVSPLWPNNLRIWDFGDGSPPVYGNASLQHAYQQAGTYLATLIAGSTVSGCSDTTSAIVNIGEIPVAKIITGDGCAGHPVTLTDQSAVQGDTLVSWKWYADTIGPIVSKNPVVNFQKPGTYPLSLVITSASGCIDSVTQPLTIHPSPVPGFVMSPVFGIPPLLVTFQNTSTGADSYLWDFSDGTTSTLFNPSHTFTQKGIFPVFLTAFSNAGCQNTFADEIFTISPALDIEVIRLEASVNNNLLKLAVDFRNNSMVELSRVNLYAWVMGESPLMESWNATSLADRLLPGHSRRYEFFSLLAVPEGEEKSRNLVCVRAAIPDFPEDTHPDNDSRCVAFNNAFAINEPFPNPTGNATTLDIIIEIPDFVTIDLFDMQGRHMGKLFDQFLDAGLNRIQIPLATFVHAGSYILSVRHRDHLAHKKIILFY
jgi:PKD repeat protein